MQPLADSHTLVQITHPYAASPARVFDAWLDPALAERWLFATASRPMQHAAIDARSGGSFCLREQRGGRCIEHRGQYLQIIRPRQLVLLLNSPDCAAADTRVSVSLTPLRSGCELFLLHEGLPAAHAEHVQARWEGMCYGLESVLAQRHAG